MPKSKMSSKDCQKGWTRFERRRQQPFGRTTTAARTARALVRDPSILVMDEATSALDAETERKVIENLSHRGCTQVIVAHRLSTIRDADLILVMIKGRSFNKDDDTMINDQDGPYAQLLRRALKSW